jgi:hypothetical protein
MKKTYLSLLLSFLSIASFVQAQTTFGIRGGASSANLKGDAVNNLQSLFEFTNGAITATDRTGFFGGGYVNIPVSNQFSVEPAVYYSQKGYQLRGDLNLKGIGFLGANAKAQLNTSYIDVPVLLKANISGFQVFAGPQVSYLTSASLRTTAGALGFNLIDEKMDATNQFNKWDAAITGGVGYQFANGFNIMASYDHGLSKVDAGQNLSTYNRAFKVGIGMSF